MQSNYNFLHGKRVVMVYLNNEYIIQNYVLMQKPEAAVKRSILSLQKGSSSEFSESGSKRAGILDKIPSF